MRSPHAFHIPVMGTGFTLDTPLRVGRYGIDSVMSIVDDVLVERVRRHHAARLGLEVEPIAATSPDARARRITAWCDLVHDELARQMEVLRATPLVPGSDKSRSFELLPGDAPARRAYAQVLAMMPGPARVAAEAALDAYLVAGAADVNIMTKLDRARRPEDAREARSDAKAALRGFAASRLSSSVVLSAGMNPTLYGLLESLPGFHRDDEGRIRKGVILKVSDFRSALVQGKFLAKKGIEVREFRVESGLNCGGHAFATEGELLGPILEAFRDGRAALREAVTPLLHQYYAARGLPFVGPPVEVRVTVQGGLGTHGELRRMHEHFGVDGTGWATPFLLVPEVTALDDATRARLAAAREADLYLSDASPLGVPFHNVRGSSSERETDARIAGGEPGSPCPNGYLAFDQTVTGGPACTASREYQLARLRQLGHDRAPPRGDPDPRVQQLYAKQCICTHLGNGLLIELGLARPDAPVAVCPGPNVAYFDRTYTLEEMVDHIYGRGPSLVPSWRPHVLAKELVLYVDVLERRLRDADARDEAARLRAQRYTDTLRDGIAHALRLAEQAPYEGENLASLRDVALAQRQRMEALGSGDCVRSRASARGAPSRAEPRGAST